MDALRRIYRAVGLLPLLVICALLSGIKLGGIVGGLLAASVAGLQVILSESAAEIQPPTKQRRRTGRGM